MYRFVISYCIIISLIGQREIVNGKSIKEDFVRIPLTVSEHSSRVRRQVVGGDGTKIELWNDKNLHYGFNITIGTPPQRFVMNMDTGSSDIWVPSVNCSSKYLCQAINKYNASASSTQKPAPGDRTFKLEYAVGALSGVISTDIISYGGLTIKDQRFAEAINEPSDSYNYPFDGTFGFGFAQISNSDTKSTPIDNLFDQGQIKKRMFCIHFNQKDATPGGELIIGGCDVEAEKWLELSQPNVTWQTKVSSVDVIPTNPNDTKTITVCKDGCNVLFDTGSAIIGGQADVLDTIANKVGATYNESYNEYFIACDATDLPTIDFKFGEFITTLTSADYVTPFWGNLCRLGVMRLPKTTFDGLLLGDPFLRELSVIFDKENLRVGVAKRK